MDKAPTAAAVALAAVALFGATAPSSDPSTDRNPELLAGTAGQAQGADTVGKIGSSSKEALAYHIHAHLSVYVDGEQKLIPYGIGIAPPYTLTASDTGIFVSNGSTFHYLHTHDETGIIHVESPTHRTYTLGDFFDLWHQPLSADRVGPAHGPVTAYVNGRRHQGSPRDIPLTNRESLQLDVGRDTPFHPYTWPTDH